MASKAVTAPPLMDSFVKVVVSLPMTTPAPAVPPPPRVAVTVAGKPSAPNADAFELVTVRFDVVPVCSVIAPPATVEGFAVPVIESILASSVVTLSVTLSWLPTAPAATNVTIVPLTVMVSPTPKFDVSEFVPGAPDNVVAPVMGAGTAALLLTALPVTVASVKGVAGVPMICGLKPAVKSAGFKPPSAVNVPAAAVELATVDGLVGRLAAYVILVVACAGMKLF